MKYIIFLRQKKQKLEKKRCSWRSILKPQINILNMIFISTKKLHKMWRNP